MQEIRLTATSYIVLGLLDWAGEGTSYDLKQRAAASVGYFWSIPHSQLYAEPQRLAAAGYVTERRESTGRRRRVYAITEHGRAALETWREISTGDLAELRDPALLKLFFGADSGALARAQVEAHRARLQRYQRQRELDPGTEPRGPWLALDAGISHEREWIRFWTDLAAADDERAPGDTLRVRRA